MRPTRLLIALVLVGTSLLGNAANAANGLRPSTTLVKKVGDTVRVPKGYTLHRTFLFGTLQEGMQLQVVKETKAGAKIVRLPKSGTYRMTNDAAQMRFGFKDKGFTGDKVVVKR